MSPRFRTDSSIPNTVFIIVSAAGRRKEQVVMSKSPSGSAPVSSGPIVELRGVTKTYAGARPFTALRGIDLRVDAGELVAIVGRSGSGKSTLLNVIAGIDRPTGGTASVAGARLDELDEGALAVWRGAQLGIVFQFFQLLPTLTIAENVILPMELARIGTRASRRARALELLAKVEIADQADKLPSALSGGQQQRAAIARALSNDPRLIVADEPTGNLDSRTSEAVLALFVELARGGRAVVLVSHERDVAAIADRTITLADGAIARIDTRRDPLPDARRAREELLHA
ncbi:MAG TPA: ABC transporter ATP-binding protein [Kofleriaceae bacterium]|nr:ABC transporter ATP-binding protein [Kofleriaceae bacterium]